MLKKSFNMITDILLVLLILILIFNLFSIFYSKISGFNKTISLFGYEFFIDISNSMEPEIKKGDFIVAKKTDCLDLKLGDIIIFNDMNHDITITHRIVDISKTDSGKLKIVTKGDMNNSNDTETVNPNTIEAKYLFKIPKLGTLLLFFSTPSGILTIILIIIMLFLISYLFSLFLKKKS